MARITPQTIIDRQRRLKLPPEGAMGRDIIDEMNLDEGRRATLMRDGGFEPIEAGKRYRPEEVVGRSGKPFKVQDIPERTKGAGANALFTGKRTTQSRKIITEQVEDIVLNLYKDGVDFDDEDADWVVFPNFRLPENWKKVAWTTPVLVVFPTAYPEVPPVGFYITNQIPLAPNGHLYPAVYHDASQEPISKGWKWYCVYVQPGTWRPSPVRQPGDWSRGDNLWTYLTLIKEVLATSD